MKAMVCEICGSNEFLKQEGMYVCEACGTKFTVEEARKLIIDKSPELENLLVRAQRFFDEGELYKACEYCERVLDIDANYQDAVALLAKVKAQQNWEWYYRLAKQNVESLTKHPRQQLCLYSFDNSYQCGADLIAKMPDTKAREKAKQELDDVWMPQVSTAKFGERLLLLIDGNFRPTRLTDAEWEKRLVDLNYHYPIFSEIFAQGIKNASDLWNAGVGVRVMDGEYDDSYYWSLNDKNLCKFSFVYGNTVIVNVKNAHQRITIFGHKALVYDTDTITNIIYTLTSEHEHLKAGRCPRCYKKSLNWLKSKCKACDWKSSS